MESLVLRCPQEVTPSLNQIVNSALEYIKYDPVSQYYSYSRSYLFHYIKNYAADDDEEDEDEEMNDADDDDDEAADAYVKLFSIQ